MTRDIDLWGIAVCPGDVRLDAAPDAPFGAVCSSATRRLFDLPIQAGVNPINLAVARFVMPRK